MITIYETEDEVTDVALLKSVAGLLRERPGSDEVRLIIHDAAGDEPEYKMERATVSEELARSIEKLLAATKGTARVRSGRNG